MSSVLHSRFHLQQPSRYGLNWHTVAYGSARDAYNFPPSAFNYIEYVLMSIMKLSDNQIAVIPGGSIPPAIRTFLVEFGHEILQARLYQYENENGICVFLHTEGRYGEELILPVSNLQWLFGEYEYKAG